MFSGKKIFFECNDDDDDDDGEHDWKCRVKEEKKQGELANYNHANKEQERKE